MNIDVGDVVQLHSGGCDMTVSDVLTRYDYNTGVQYEEVSCVWHDSNFTPCRIDYASIALKVKQKRNNT